MSSLRNLDPAALARRAFQLADEYENVHGLPRQRAEAAAIGCVSIEADELKRERIGSAPLGRETYEHPHGGFTGRSTLPRWLVELESDSGEEQA